MSWGNAVCSPQTFSLMAGVDSRSAKAIDVIFCALNGTNQIQLVYPMCIDIHILCHSSYFIEIHLGVPFNLRFGVFTVFNLIGTI